MFIFEKKTMAKIINFCLQNDTLETPISGDERIKTWKNEEPRPIENSEIQESQILNDILHLADELKNTSLSILDSDSNFAFSLNKKTILGLLNQEGCEGISFIINAKLVNTKRVLNLKAIPVNDKVEELYNDERFLSSQKSVFVCLNATECPPKSGCPVGIVKTFDLFLNKDK